MGCAATGRPGRDACRVRRERRSVRRWVGARLTACQLQLGRLYREESPGQPAENGPASISAQRRVGVKGSGSRLQGGFLF